VSVRTHSLYSPRPRRKKKMNERIKELCSKAISDVDGIQNPDTQHMYIPGCFRDRFAELIVKECMKICQNHPSIIFKNEWDADVVATDIVSRLESHFGVTE